LIARETNSRFCERRRGHEDAPVRTVVHEDHAYERLHVSASDLETGCVPLALDHQRPPLSIAALDVNGEIAGPADRSHAAVPKFAKEAGDGLLEASWAHGQQLIQGPYPHPPLPLDSVTDPESQGRE
jgi:hypothetical protein